MRYRYDMRGGRRLDAVEVVLSMVLIVIIPLAW